MLALCVGMGAADAALAGKAQKDAPTKEAPKVPQDLGRGQYRQSGLGRGRAAARHQCRALADPRPAEAGRRRPLHATQAGLRAAQGRDRQPRRGAGRRLRRPQGRQQGWGRRQARPGRGGQHHHRRHPDAWLGPPPDRGRAPRPAGARRDQGRLRAARLSEGPLQRRDLQGEPHGVRRRQGRAQAGVRGPPRRPRRCWWRPRPRSLRRSPSPRRWPCSPPPSAWRPRRRQSCRKGDL
ncbi:hypothetical protein ACRAWD_19655 [Caulobacter segnis]